MVTKAKILAFSKKIYKFTYTFKMCYVYKKRKPNITYIDQYNYIHRFNAKYLLTIPLDLAAQLIHYEFLELETKRMYL